MKWLPLLLVFAASSAAATECGVDKAIWAHERDGERVVFYYAERGFVMGGDVRFESWQGNTMSWRVDGSITCSNGVPFCYLDVPTNGKDTIQDVPVDDVVVDGFPKYLVFSHLSERTYRTSMLEGSEHHVKAAYTKGFSLDEPIVLPSDYVFFGCQKGD